MNLEGLKDYLTFSASQVGEECPRRIAYHALGTAAEIPEKTKKYLAPGHAQEKVALQLLRDFRGLHLEKTALDGGQAELVSEVRFSAKRPKFFLMCHPDGLYKKGAHKWGVPWKDMKKGNPWEIKALNPFYFRRLKNAWTLARFHPKYYTQVQMQIFSADARCAGFVVRNKEADEKDGDSIKTIFISRDEEHITATFRKLGEISDHVINLRQLPPPPWNPGSEKCKRCFFIERCVTDHQAEQEAKVAQMVPAFTRVDDEEVSEALSRYALLNEHIKKLEGEKDELNAYLKNTMASLKTDSMGNNSHLATISLTYPERTDMKAVEAFYKEHGKEVPKQSAKKPTVTLRVKEIKQITSGQEETSS